ncbi:MAG TPA: VCBS repeat-containing protein [Planctomycetota bacterium]|nr:VCBS repeat-containing protein [Planctomycetota bacterium]
MSGASFHASGHLEIGRFNADAYDDVASSVNGVPWLTAPVKILFGGPGGLGAPTNAGFNGWGPMAAGDFDGDGDVDLFQHGPQTPLPPFPPLQPPPPPTAYTPILALNDGAGVFTVGAAPAPLPPLSSLRPWVADLDGDGAQDVLVYATAYLQSAPGVFATTPAYAPTVPMFGASVQAFPCDVDGDGAADVLAGDGMWYRSQGALPLPLEGALPFPLTRVHFGDPDRDGDVDVLSGDQLVLNRTRHLLRDGLFRTGRSLRFVVSGAPNAPWLLAASLGTLDLDLPPYGRLLIDPATVALIGGGVLDATGAGAWSSVAPSGAAAAPLLGLPVYVQAVVDGGAPRFTGAWTAVLIDV